MFRQPKSTQRIFYLRPKATQMYECKCPSVRLSVHTWGTLCGFFTDNLPSDGACGLFCMHVGCTPHAPFHFKGLVQVFYISVCTKKNAPHKITTDILWAASHLFTDMNVCPVCHWSHRPHSLAPNLPSVKKKNLSSLSRNLSP